jgi:hypothetical protein
MKVREQVTDSVGVPKTIEGNDGNISISRLVHTFNY